MRLYKAQYTEAAYEDGDLWPLDTFTWADAPEGWDDYCMEHWGETRDFYPPSDRKVYRSRSSAHARVDLINHWLGDGSAILVETETNWMPTAEAAPRIPRWTLSAIAVADKDGVRPGALLARRVGPLVVGGGAFTDPALKRPALFAQLGLAW